MKDLKSWERNCNVLITAMSLSRCSIKDVTKLQKSSCDMLEIKL